MLDLEGKRFGRLTVLQKAGSCNAKKTLWLCRCDCGNEKEIIGSNLNSGKTKSCGCLKAERSTERIKTLTLTHGKTNTRLYHIWRGMKARCLNPNSLDFDNYGGRGIKVCDEWLNSFRAFYNWAMANGYEERLTIDRVNVNGDYCPENCRWAGTKAQQNNRRNNKTYAFNGSEHTLSEWSEITGVKYSTLNTRVNRFKWDIGKALFTPVKQYKRGEKEHGKIGY